MSALQIRAELRSFSARICPKVLSRARSHCRKTSVARYDCRKTVDSDPPEFIFGHQSILQTVATMCAADEVKVDCGKKGKWLLFNPNQLEKLAQ
jgi:hypothetical protein